MTQYLQVESSAVENLVKQVVGRESSYKSWFSDARFEITGTGKCELLVGSQFRCDWIRKQYLKTLEKRLNEDLGINLELKLFNNSENISKKGGVASESVALADLKAATRGTQNSNKKSGLPKRGFRFDEYIPGKENRLALAAAKSIAEDAGLHCSPLFITGEHGLGKTHLVSCIADAWPDAQVECLLAEEFSNSYVQANRSNERDHFQARIRSKKVLIVEDLDFFLEGNKKGSIQELIHSIKILKREGRYVVLTSSRALPDFKNMSHQLYEILLASLSVRLTKPGEASRSKLLKMYLRKYGLKVTPRAKEELEKVPFESPTQIKGVMKQLVAFARLQDEALDLQLVKDVMTDFQLMLSDVAGGSMGEDLHQIAKVVSREFGVSIPKILSKSRERYVCLARHAAMRLSYDAHFTLKEIGQFYGGRAHQTVLASIRRGKEMEQGDKEVASIYKRLRNQI